MNSQTLATWVQVLTTLSVLIGLGLVIYELRQSKAIATADVLGQQFAMGAQFDSVVLGEDVATSLAKTCLGEEITARDAIVLRSYFWGTYDKFFMIRQANLAGDMELQWRGFAATVLRTQVFTYRSGRTWWAEERDNMPQDIVAIGDNVLSSLAQPSCASRIAPYLGRKSDGS